MKIYEMLYYYKIERMIARTRKALPPQNSLLPFCQKKLSFRSGLRKVNVTAIYCIGHPLAISAVAIRWTGRREWLLDNN